MDTITFIFTLTLSWLLIYLLLSWIKRKKSKVSEAIDVYPFLLLIKTKKFNNAIVREGKKRDKIWDIIGELSIIYGISALLYALYFFIKNLLAFIFPTNVGNASPVVPLIFGITFNPPLDQLIIIIIIIVIAVVTHELFHGLIASSSNIDLKSTGAGVVYVIPMAFVELDESSLNKAPKKSKLKVYGAGSFINLVEGILFLLLIISFPLVISWGFSTTPSGVLIISTVPGSPASIHGFQQGDAIIAINGTLIKDSNSFTHFLSTTKPNQTVVITIERDLKDFNVTLTLARNNYTNTGFIGVSTINYYRPYYSFIPSILQYYIYTFLAWGSVIFLSLAVINMLPIPMLDGDKFLGEILSSIKNQNIRTFVWNSSRLVSLLILIINIVFSIHI